MAKRKPRTPFEELLEAAGHDARVTVWEQTFVASIREQIEARDQPWLSDQQSRPEPDALGTAGVRDGRAGRPTPDGMGGGVPLLDGGGCPGLPTAERETA